MLKYRKSASHHVQKSKKFREIVSCNFPLHMHKLKMAKRKIREIPE